MGNCTATRMGRAASGEEEPVVALCRQRKLLIKLAVDRRYALADTHCRYLHSLNSVAAALHFFVARHSAPATPFLITLPTPSDAEDVAPPPLPRPPPPAVGAPPAARSSTSSESSSCSRSSGEELCQGVGEGAPPGCPYFYSEVPAAEQQEGEMMGWDFFSFNPFSREVAGGDGRSWDEELRAVREQEGIPELEEEEDVGGQQEKVKEKEHHLQDDGGECREMVGGGKEEGSHAEEEEKVLSVMETAGSERELLEALRDVEDHFLRAYDSGKEVSRMLEANRVHLQSGLEEIKGVSFFLPFEPSTHF